MGVIRNCKSKDRQYQRGVITNRKSKDRQYNGQKKKGQNDKYDLHNITQKTKDWATRTPLKKPEGYIVIVPPDEWLRRYRWVYKRELDIAFLLVLIDSLICYLNIWGKVII